MAATATPLSLVQGQTYTLDVTYAGTEDPPVARSLAGYRARMSVRRRKSITSPLVFDLTSAVDGGLTIEPGGQTGLVVVRISAQLTELLTKTTAYYDLFIINIVDPTDAQRLIAGPIAIDLSVTDVTPAGP